MQGVIIVNGYPGVGKLTICRDLQRLLPGSKVFSNHNLIDIAASVLERDHPLYDTFRKALREALFNTLSQFPSHQLSPQKCISYPIFTEVLDTTPDDVSVAGEYLALARELNVTVYSVALACSDEENVRRLTSRTPAEGCTKLVDVEILREIRETTQVHQFKDDTEGVVALDVVVDQMSPKAVAKLIVREFHLLKS